MKNQLEQFVQQNKQAFDMYEPNQKVWKEIKERTALKKSSIMVFMKYAASVIIFVVGFSVGIGYKNLSDEDKLAKSEHVKRKEQIQLIESEYYYATQINDKMHELEPFFASDPQLKQDIEIDFEELDSFYEQLKADLQDDINNQHVIEAMIQSYEMKLEILETLLEQLKPSNNERTSIDI